MPKTLAATIALATFLAACSDDPAEPSIPDVAGSWTYAATSLTGSGITCSFRHVPMTLAQNGTTFSGAYSGGVFACSGPGGSISEQVAGGAVASGTIDGNSVEFDIDSPDWRNTGTISGSSMSGTVVVRASDGTTTITLTGDFTASKQ